MFLLRYTWHFVSFLKMPMSFCSNSLNPSDVKLEVAEFKIDSKGLR